MNAECSSLCHLVARVDVDALVCGGEGVAHGLLGAQLLGKVEVKLARRMRKGLEG